MTELSLVLDLLPGVLELARKNPIEAGILAFGALFAVLGYLYIRYRELFNVGRTDILEKLAQHDVRDAELVTRVSSLEKSLVSVDDRLREVAERQAEQGGKLDAILSLLGAPHGEKQG